MTGRWGFSTIDSQLIMRRPTRDSVVATCMSAIPGIKGGIPLFTEFSFLFLFHPRLPRYSAPKPAEPESDLLRYSIVVGPTAHASARSWDGDRLGPPGKMLTANHMIPYKGDGAEPQAPT